MLNLMAEVIAISWRGNTTRQEDAILIDNKVLQYSDSRITPVYQQIHTLCVAVSDGVRHSPVPHKASKAVLSRTGNSCVLLTSVIAVFIIINKIQAGNS